MRTKKYPWLKQRLPSGTEHENVKDLLNSLRLHTVCQEAKCPNMAECFSKKTATFLILGDICSRDCKYCNVKTGRPSKVDAKEAERIAKAVKTLGLKYVVLTSVTRDDLQDGGARTYTQTMKEIRKLNKKVKIELLTPDFRDQIKKILAHHPDVFGHNIEIVKRLFPKIRPQGNYIRSLVFLKQIKEFSPRQITKSGLMVGLGETKDEIIETLQDLKKAKVDIVTIGQYLQPRIDLHEVEKYYHPSEFEEFREIGENLGLKMLSGPLVRSSYRADELV